MKLLAVIIYNGHLRLYYWRVCVKFEVFEHAAEYDPRILVIIYVNNNYYGGFTNYRRVDVDVQTVFVALHRITHVVVLNALAARRRRVPHTRPASGRSRFLFAFETRNKKKKKTLGKLLLRRHNEFRFAIIVRARRVFYPKSQRPHRGTGVRYSLEFVNGPSSPRTRHRPGHGPVFDFHRRKPMAGRRATSVR